MKKFKRIATFVLSMVMVFSLFTYNVCADDYPDYVYELYPHVESINRHFRLYGVEMEDYAEAYATSYYAEDCDLGVKTWVVNQHKDFREMDENFAITAYVSLEVEFESGLSGFAEDITKCDIGADSGVVRMFALWIVEPSETDSLVYFCSTHEILDVYRDRDPLANRYWYAQDLGTNTLYITTPDE